MKKLNFFRIIFEVVFMVQNLKPSTFLSTLVNGSPFTTFNHSNPLREFNKRILNKGSNVKKKSHLKIYPKEIWVQISYLGS